MQTDTNERQGFSSPSDSVLQHCIKIREEAEEA